jgi:hypothetical protein
VVSTIFRRISFDISCADENIPKLRIKKMTSEMDNL